MFNSTFRKWEVKKLKELKKLMTYVVRFSLMRAAKPKLAYASGRAER